MSGQGMIHMCPCAYVLFNPQIVIKMCQYNCRYLYQHAYVWHCFKWPCRLNTYWDPTRGVQNFQRDSHLLNKGCPKHCKYCEAGVPKWTEEEYYLSHAWALGFWDHPDLAEARAQVLEKDGVAIILHDGSEDLPARVPRMGISLHPVLDKFYDTYLGIAAVNSMETERTLSKVKFLLGHVSRIGEGRVNFLLQRYNPTASDRLGGVSNEEWDASLRLVSGERAHAAALNLLLQR